VWAPCPLFNVLWRNVEFEDEAVRDPVLKAWGDHPDLPGGEAIRTHSHACWLRRSTQHFLM
jgi:hypothetical protein